MNTEHSSIVYYKKKIELSPKQHNLKQVKFYLFIFDFARLNPCFDLVSIPLKLFYLLFQIRFKFFLLVGIIRIINLKKQGNE